MNWYYVQTESTDKDKRNAGAKAPADVSAILANMGLSRLVLSDVGDRQAGGALSKLGAHRRALDCWLEAIGTLSDGDGIVMQLPFATHTIWFNRVVDVCRRRNIRLVLLVHDLESIRLALAGGASFAQTMRFKMEESSVLSYAQAIIVHNDRMADFASEHFGYERSRFVSLGLFDYLIPGFTSSGQRAASSDAVVVAGNLRPDKAGYLYDIPNDVDFNFYGIGYEKRSDFPRVNYCGSYSAEELPMKLEGSFGLVWDGPEGKTCSGVYGDYLKINNPHKTSLYLASGLPVIVWKDAAVASFVRQEGVGICIGSLYDLRSSLDRLCKADYEKMVSNVARVGEKLRAGGFTTDAVRKACGIAVS